MRVDGRPTRTIWPLDVEEDGVGRAVGIIDQTRLPHTFVTVELRTPDDAVLAIRDMLVRGAPLIGATAAYGVALATNADASDAALDAAHDALFKTRPTAVNLRWALDEMRAALRNQPPAGRARIAWRRAAEVAEEDVAINEAIGRHGLAVFQEAAAKKPKGEPLNVLTHCNAGWLATVDWGTATAPVYMAHEKGLPLHVWVDETRPRNQGASLTAWELNHHGVPHTVIPDNSGGLLMRRGMVDLVIVGTDRTTRAGDVCNKIGTYLKALAAKDNNVPFYVALPSPTIDFSLEDGGDIPIEERSAKEVTHISGKTASGEVVAVQVTPDGSPAANHAFDVTPARLVTGLITERGVAEASDAGIAALFPERSTLRVR